jgi:acyl-[acyl-carrier-protein]-phospholipid O-acyltransferase / long-chain-fatty-acid--[acyl-carrier-protein] ligase
MPDSAISPLPDAGHAPGTPTRTPAHQPDWGSLIRLLVVQTQNAFNDKVAQFALLGMAKVFLDKAQSARYAHIVSALLVVPLLFFAPVAGWVSDRCRKSQVVLWSSVAQVVLLLLCAGAFALEWFWTATGLFFLLALQGAVLQPAKGGMVKEYVGERYLGMASGWVQMSAILAFVSGQWAGGRIFEHFYETGTPPDAGMAACWTLLLMAGLSLAMVVLSLQMKPTNSHTDEPFRRGMMVEHFHHLGELLRVRKLRLTALGVSYFWFASVMLTLMLIQLATQIEPNEASQAERGGMLFAFVGAGVAAGCLLTAWLSADKIELGLVPLGGLGMAAGAVATLAVDPAGMVFRGLMFWVGAASAVFLVPLNAYLQDLLEPRVRGRMLSAAGLLDALAMMIAICLQLLWMKLGVPVLWQFAILGVLCLATSVYVLKIIPQNFLRFTVLGLIRVIYRTRSLHAARVPETGGALLISNHVSYVDALVLSATCDREVVFTVYDGFFNNPFLSRFMHLFGVVPISEKRAKDAIVTMADAVKKGNLVCIFAEGQVTRTGFMNEVRKGFELIARRAGAPVIPVYLDALWGSIFSFEGGRFFTKWPQHFPVHLTAVWGEPIPPDQVAAAGVRAAFQQLAQEGLYARPEVRRTLRLAITNSLCRKPWRLALADAEGAQDPGRRLSRGTLFAQAMHLARRWEPFALGRVLVVLPDGVAAVMVLLALKLAGKVPVLLPPALLSGGGLREFLEQENIRSVVSHTWLRAAHPDAPWPDHFLDVHAEMEETDDLHLLGDFAFAALATPTVQRLRGEWRGSQDGVGWILLEQGGGWSLILSPDREVLARTGMLQGVDLLRQGDVVLSCYSLASAGGQALLWSCLMRGLPLVLAPPAADPRIGSAWRAEYEPTVAAGDAGLAGALAVPGPPLRLFLHWTPDGAAMDAAARDLLTTTAGTEVCEGLTHEASGALVAASLPHPPLATSTAEPQYGWRAGSPGKLLPGLLPDALPRGWRQDETGFVHRAD